MGAEKILGQGRAGADFRRLLGTRHR